MCSYDITPTDWSKDAENAEYGDLIAGLMYKEIMEKYTPYGYLKTKSPVTNTLFDLSYSKFIIYTTYIL